MSTHANGSGSVTYELGAQEGHKWVEARIGLSGVKDDQLTNAVELSLDGENWETLAENQALDPNDEFDITETVAGAQRFWVRARYKSSATDDVNCLVSVAMEGRIQ